MSEVELDTVECSTSSGGMEGQSTAGLCLCRVRASPYSLLPLLRGPSDLTYLIVVIVKGLCYRGSRRLASHGRPKGGQKI